MKKIISMLVGAGVFILFLKFNPFGSNSAIKYNDKLIGEQNLIIEKMLALTDSFNSRNTQLMNEKLKTLQIQITQSADTLSQMEGYKGDTHLRNKLLDLIEFYESMSQEELGEMVKILSKSDTNITQADVNRLKVMENDIRMEEREFDLAVQKAQKEFAQRYNIKIKPNKYQKRIDSLNK